MPAGRDMDWLLGRPGGVRRTLWAVLTGRFDPHEVLARGRPVAAPVDEGGWHDAAASAELGEGTVIEVSVEGRGVALARHRGALHAVDAVCPHAGGPLGEGEVRRGEIVCPLHGWAFDLGTGVCATGVGMAVTVHAARERDGRVQIRLADPAATSRVP